MEEYARIKDSAYLSSISSGGGSSRTSDNCLVEFAMAAPWEKSAVCDCILFDVWIMFIMYVYYMSKA